MVLFVYSFALARIFHVTVKSLFFSSNFQRCLLNSVSFLLLSCLNGIWWFQYLALNWFAGRPTHVSFVSWVLTVAKCTPSFIRQSPSSRHSSFFLQLHFFPSSCRGCAVSAFFIMALSWPSINCLTLSLHAAVAEFQGTCISVERLSL